MTNRKILAAVATAIALFGTAPAVLAQPSIDSQFAPAAIHAQPTSGSEVIAQLQDEDLVSIKSCFANWCEVSWNGGEGYAHQSVLDLDGYLASPATNS